MRYGRKLGLTEPFLTDVADVVIQRMGGAYPDLVENRAFILRILEGEEQQFGRVMEQGLNIMEEALTATDGHGGVFPEPSPSPCMTPTASPSRRPRTSPESAG